MNIMSTRTTSLLLSLLSVGCEGTLVSSDDVGARADAANPPGLDAAVDPSLDAAIPPGVDVGPSLDAGPSSDTAVSVADAGRSAGCGVAHEAGFTCVTETWGGAERRYCVDVRAGYDPMRAQAIVLGLHGCGGSPEGAHGNTEPQVAAGAGELLFVYPAALGSCWEYSAAPTIDVDYVRHVIEAVSATHCVAPGRVFADGMSSGGMMTSRLLCDGVARAGAAISLNYSCATPRPVWLYGGTADEYYADYIEPGRDGWLRTNGCSATTRPLPEGPCVEYEGCSARTIWCTDDRGHVWPREAWTAQIVELFRSTP